VCEKITSRRLNAFFRDTRKSVQKRVRNELCNFRLSLWYGCETFDETPQKHWKQDSLRVFCTCLFALTHQRKTIVNLTKPRQK